MTFLPYLGSKDFQKVSEKLWNVFEEKIKNTKDDKAIPSCIARLSMLINCE